MVVASLERIPATRAMMAATASARSGFLRQWLNSSMTLKGFEAAESAAAEAGGLSGG